MSVVRERRCQNCGTHYAYHLSGYGCADPDNDGRWCPSCAKVVREALETVEPKRRARWKAVSDVSVSDLVERFERGRAERRAAALEAGTLCPERVYSNLYDLTNPSNHNKVGEVSVDGVAYRFDYWTHDGPEGGNAFVEVEVDAETGEVLGPWDLNARWPRWPTFCEPKPRGEHPPTHVFKPCPIPSPKRSS